MTTRRGWFSTLMGAVFGFMVPVKREPELRYATTDDTEFFREILKVHPDARGISESKEFVSWLDTQPRYIQDAARSSDSPDDAIHIITSYKSATDKAGPAHLYSKRTLPHAVPSRDIPVGVIVRVDQQRISFKENGRASS